MKLIQDRLPHGPSPTSILGLSGTYTWKSNSIAGVGRLDLTGAGEHVVFAADTDAVRSEESAATIENFIMKADEILTSEWRCTPHFVYLQRSTLYLLVNNDHNAAQQGNSFPTVPAQTSGVNYSILKT